VTISAAILIIGTVKLERSDVASRPADHRGESITALGVDGVRRVGSGHGNGGD
jgi:hypothetical protein